jgi:cytochrome c-type biogenesis protein CcmH
MQSIRGGDLVRAKHIYKGYLTAADRTPAFAGVVCFVIASLILISFSFSAFAVEPDEMLKNPALEARAREISKDLRCLVCQGQSIDDSDADLAKDFRILVRQRLTSGDTDAQVRQYLKDRYGDFILLDPPVEQKTLLLWLTPLVILGAGLGVAGVFIRKNKS